MPKPETSMPIKLKNREEYGVNEPKCMMLAMKSEKSRSNPPSTKMIHPETSTAFAARLALAAIAGA